MSNILRIESISTHINNVLFKKNNKNEINIESLIPITSMTRS
jgi:hypothetical protein